MPKISVIMSVYMEPVDWIVSSIDSILNQSYNNFEFIIVNDKPERSENAVLLEDYARRDDRIKIVTNKTNIGLTKSLNKALSIAAGEFIARMDADDISLPRRFEKQVRVLEDSENRVDVCGTGIEYFGNFQGILLFPERHEDCLLFLDNCFAHSSIMMNRKLLALRYDENCKAAQDYDLWNRAYQSGCVFYNIPEVLLRYRYSDNQISTAKSSIQMNVACKVRRNALDYYMKNRDIPFQIGDNPIRISWVGKIIKLLELKEEQNALLFYYLCLSLNEPKYKIIMYSCSSYIKGKLSSKRMVSVIKHAIKNNDKRKY